MRGWQRCVPLTREGRIFIDRSPKLFAHVLDVSRSDSDMEVRASSSEEAKKLQREFEYYGVEAPGRFGSWEGQTAERATLTYEVQ